MKPAAAGGQAAPRRRGRRAALAATVYVFVQPVMKRISAGADRTEAPAGPGSFMMLNYIWSDSPIPTR